MHAQVATESPTVTTRITAAALTALCAMPLFTYRKMSFETVGPYSVGYTLFLALYVVVLLLVLFWAASPPRFHAFSTRVWAAHAAFWEKQEQRGFHRITVAVVVVINLLLLGLILPSAQWSFTTPYLYNDHCVYFDRLRSVTAFLGDNGRFEGYDPYFLAGYPEGGITNIDMMWTHLLGFLLSKLGVPLAAFFNYEMLLKYVLGPLAVYAAAAVHGTDRRTRLLALLIALLTWHCDLFIRIFTSIGTTYWIFIAFLAPLAVALFSRYARTGEAKYAVGFAALAGYMLGGHVLGPIILIGPTFYLAIRMLVERRWKRFGGMVVAAVCAILPNLVYARSILLTAHWLAPADKILEDSLVDQMLMNWPSAMLTVSIPAITTVIAIAYLARLREGPLSDARGELLAYILWTAYVGYLGSHYPPTNNMQPARFSSATAVAAVLPVAALCAYALRVRWDEALASLPRSFRPGPVIVFIFICVAAPGFSYLAPEGDSLMTNLKQLSSWIEKHTEKGPRILFEDRTPDTLSPTGARYYLDREFIGGPFSRAALIHRFAGAGTESGELFGKPIDQLTVEDWQQAIKLYRIATVVAESGELNGAVTRFPELFEKVDELTVTATDVASHAPWGRTRTFSMYKVKSPAQTFPEGNGELSATYNRIEVKHATKGKLILPYHWLEGLETEPALKLNAVKQWRDPVPFIEVENGDVTDFVIRYRPK